MKKLIALIGLGTCLLTSCSNSGKVIEVCEFGSCSGVVAKKDIQDKIDNYEYVAICYIPAKKGIAYQHQLYYIR